MAEGDTWVNALIGAVVTTVLGGFVPLVPVLGGGVAAYLEGGDRNAGVKVGAISGLIALIPFILLVLLAASILSTMGMGMGFGMFGADGMMIGFGAGVGLFMLFVALIFGLIYIVGLSIVGGWLGNYVRHDTDIDI